MPSRFFWTKSIDVGKYLQKAHGTANHEALHSLLVDDDPRGHLMRLSLRLADLDLEAIYSKGNENIKAEELSKTLME